MGVGSIAFYAVANSLVVYLMDFIGSIAAVVSPMATKLNTEGKMSDLREIFLKWSKAALSLTIMAGLFLIVPGPRFIGWWIGPSFDHPAGHVLQSEEHTSELQSRENLVCRLLLEKKKNT